MENEIFFNAGIVFYVLDLDIELFSSETIYGWKTFAQINDKFHYLDDEYINIETAVNLWQYLNNRLLSKEEMRSIMTMNNLGSGAY